MKIALLIGAALLAAPAAAHPEHTPAAALSAGLLHPFSGLDHLLAMLGIGLWSGQQKQGLALPAVFLAAMAAGALALGAVALPPAGEFSLAAGVALIGALVAAGVRVPAWAAGSFVASLALLHGQAHGSELPALASAAGYLLASAALLMAGRVAARAPWQRAGGALIGLAGLGLLAGFA